MGGNVVIPFETKEIDTRLDSTEQDIAGIKSQLSGIGAQLTSLGEALSGIQEQLGALESRIDVLETEPVPDPVPEPEPEPTPIPDTSGPTPNRILEDDFRAVGDSGNFLEIPPGEYLGGNSMLHGAWLTKKDPNEYDKMIFEQRGNLLNVKAWLSIAGSGDNNTTLRSGPAENSGGFIHVRDNRHVAIRNITLKTEMNPGKAALTASVGSVISLENVTVVGTAENGIMPGAADSVSLKNVWINSEHQVAYNDWDHGVYITGYPNTRAVQILGGACWSPPVHTYKSRAKNTYIRGVHALASGKGANVDFPNGGDVWIEDSVLELLPVGFHENVKVGVNGERTGNVRVVEYAAGRGPDPRVLMYGRGDKGGATSEEDTRHPASSRIVLKNCEIIVPDSLERPRIQNDVLWVEGYLIGCTYPSRLEMWGNWKVI